MYSYSSEALSQDAAQGRVTLCFLTCFRRSFGVEWRAVEV